MNAALEGSSYAITVVCSDGVLDSPLDGGTFTLELESSSVAGVHIQLSSDTVPENRPAGTTVGERAALV